MKRILSIAFLSTSVFGVYETVFSPEINAQMGNTSSSIGTTRIQVQQNLVSIPEVRATAVEGIQRHSITTGGGYIIQGELLLPQAPALDSKNKLHDGVKHPYESLPSLQNTRLDLIQ